MKYWIVLPRPPDVDPATFSIAGPLGLVRTVREEAIAGFLLTIACSELEKLLKSSDASRCLDAIEQVT
jgi:hypothetical protein